MAKGVAETGGMQKKAPPSNEGGTKKVTPGKRRGRSVKDSPTSSCQNLEKKRIPGETGQTSDQGKKGRPNENVKEDRGREKEGESVLLFDGGKNE